jgi:hypothetical protein
VFDEICSHFIRRYHEIIDPTEKVSKRRISRPRRSYQPNNISLFGLAPFSKTDATTLTSGI